MLLVGLAMLTMASVQWLGAPFYGTGALYTDTASVPSNTFSTAADFGGGGAIQFVKNVGSDQCGDTSSTVTVPAVGVASGNTLVVAFVVRNTGGVGGTVSVADSGSNTYAIDVDIADSSDQVRTVILSANIGTALVQGDTITVTHPTGSSLGAVVDEFSGIASSSWVDDTGSGEGNSSTPSASATTTNADDLLYGAVGFHNNRTFTEATSWTTLTDLQMSCGGAPGNGVNHTAYRIVSATGSYTFDPTVDVGDKWAAAIAAYKGE